MWQPDHITKIEGIFKEHIKKLKIYKTPATPGQITFRSKDPSDVVDPETHTLYRSGVGMLLYLVKFSRPEISNAVREASKANIGPTKAHMKSLYRLIMFVVDTKNYRLVMESKLQKAMCGR